MKTSTSHLIIMSVVVLIAALAPMWLLAKSRDWDEARNTGISVVATGAVLALYKLCMGKD